MLPPITDEVAAEAVRELEKHGSYTAAASALGIARSTLTNRLLRAAQRGLDGNISGPKPLPLGQRLRGVSTLYDRDGAKVLEWVKTKDEPSLSDIVSGLQDAFREYEGRSILYPAPPSPNPDLLTLYPLADWHLGLYVWGQEAETNWDLDIAERTLARGMTELVASSPPSEEAIVLGGGDLIHADNSENRTSRSGHALDVDGRYAKVLDVAARLIVHTVDLALQRHDKVTVRVLQGNHDEHSSVAVAYFLLAWYRNSERVAVDCDPSLYFWKRFGRVLLGATHGHTVKIKDMPGIMAQRRAEDWGATRFRYVHGFHLHHSAKYATEGGGVISEVHQTPVPQDAYHFGSGYLSGRSIQSITYHRDFGEVSRNRMAVL